MNSLGKHLTPYDKNIGLPYRIVVCISAFVFDECNAMLLEGE